MDPFSGAIPFWDISQTPNSISQLADDDFLALLQKQFPTDATNTFNVSFPGFNNEGVNPQSLSNFPFNIPNATPPSSDSSSSDSPPSAITEPASRRQSTSFPNSDSLKRKVGEEDDEDDDDIDMDEPAHKSAHTGSNNAAASGSGGRKASSRRKSGNPTQDEVRLMKRKEQNRAAQRAFRERKEKHVKDLEDKVSALESRNERTESENGNLRDLLKRLQEENLQLKNKQSKQQTSSPFTFTVQKDPVGQFSPVNNTAQSPIQGSPFTASPPTSSNFSTVSSPQSRFLAPNSSEFNFGSLIPFDPAVLSALDESPTATDDAMNLDFGFGKQNSFNILANDPMYMSFADPSPDSASTSSSNTNHFDFSNLDSWGRQDSQPNTNNNNSMQTLDELFGGNNSFLTPQSGIDFAQLLKNSPPVPTLSPIVHSTAPSSIANSETAKSPINIPDLSNGRGCPTTREQLSERINEAGLSPFVQSPPTSVTSPTAEKCETGTQGFLKKSVKEQPPMVMCRGSSFPKTLQSEKNVEVLSAWRSITSNPQFKDVDINELCTEFTDKARCDGTKVVLEPEGVHSIIETLNAKYKSQQAQRV